MLGTAIGIPAALKVQMTAMPQMVALFNGVGGGAVAMIAWVEYRHHFGGRLLAAAKVEIPSLFAAIVGSISFWGSNIAFGKLQEILPGRPIKLPGPVDHQRRAVRDRASLSAIILAAGTHSQALFILGILVAAALLGNMVVLPIGGADMPVVISLLNAFTGLSAAATGIALEQHRDDRRRHDRRRVGHDPHQPDGEGDEPLGAGDRRRRVRRRGRGARRRRDSTAGRSARPRAQDVAIQLSYARQVVIAPGYGMAVAQAQHAVRELERALEAKGVEVKYAIHPVAGRMPGHMNVLLAEADVPYDLLKEMDEINPEFPRTDVTLVIGANDVTNPAAKNEPGLADLRDADPRGRQVRRRDRAQALDGLRLRRDRQPAVLRAEDLAAVRRRQGVGQRDHRRGPGAVAPDVRVSAAYTN